MAFAATKSEGVGLIVGAVSFQDFQPMWSQSTNVTDWQTDDMRSQDRALHCNQSWSITIDYLQKVIAWNVAVAYAYSCVLFVIVISEVINSVAVTLWQACPAPPKCTRRCGAPITRSAFVMQSAPFNRFCSPTAAVSRRW